MKHYIVSAIVAIALLGASSTALAASTIEMQVDGLVCAFCAQGIEKKLRAEGATADVFVSLERGLVAVALKPGQDITDAALGKLLTEAGYTLRTTKRTDAKLEELRAAPAEKK
ncbi:MAG TPA: heavy-metal-associated domain-containing protein [Verrucomicrobiae bacterium]|nr:heavy-metal-associated domain-containing protein [Verrucomicrobiae bacterium]